MYSTLNVLLVRMYVFTRKYKVVSTAKRAAFKRYIRTQKGRAAAYRRNRNQVKYHLQRVRCRWAFNKSVQRGYVIRPTICSICHESNGTIESHHPDYSKPYEVIWACRVCHRELDRQNLINFKKF